MSEFINYKKRGFTLPAGCKDLFDLVARKKRRAAADIKDRDLVEVTEGLSEISKYVNTTHTHTEGLTEIGKHVCRAFQSKASMAILSIVNLADQVTFKFYMSPFEPSRVMAFVGVQLDTAEEKAVREFFSRYGLKKPADSKIPENFTLGLPVYLNCPVDPLPTDARAVARLVTDLFRETCGLTDTDKLHFGIDEVHKVTIPPEIIEGLGGS